MGQWVNNKLIINFSEFKTDQKKCRVLASVQYESVIDSVVKECEVLAEEVIDRTIIKEK